MPADWPQSAKTYVSEGRRRTRIVTGIVCIVGIYGASSSQREDEYSEAAELKVKVARLEALLQQKDRQLVTQAAALEAHKVLLRGVFHQSFYLRASRSPF